jgi:hypothetical protein
VTRPRIGPRTAVVLAFACSAVYFTGFFPPRNNPNELSRIEAAVAFVESGTFSIDSTLERFGNTMDKSVWRGRYYSNKAPGLIFVMVPVYRFVRSFVAEPADGWSVVFVLVRLATVSVACVLALARFLRRAEESEGGRAVAPALAFAVAFGTPFLYYSRSLFSHAWTASLLFLSWDLIRASEERRRRPVAWLAGSGALAGWAAISEYPAALIAAALAVRAVVGPAGRPSGRGRTLLAFAAGAIPPLVLLALYNAACFGSPFRLSSACEADPAFAVLARRPFFGFRLPQLSAAWGTLFSSSRGAVLFSPFWLWAAGGWILWWRSGRDRRDCVFTLASTLLVWLPITAYPNWDGGWSFGMRYLVPAVFFAALAIPYALGGRTSRGLFLVAVAFSAALHALGSFAWPHFFQSLAWPVATASAWLIAHGAVAPNLGQFLGLSPVASLVPALVLFAFGLVAAARKFPASRPRPATAAAIGVAVLAVTLAMPVRVSSENRFHREALASDRADAGRSP